MAIEHYAEAVGKLMVALSDTPELLRPVIEYVCFLPPILSCSYHCLGPI